MTYADSLWKDAPEGASLYAFVMGPQKLVHNKLTDVWCWFKEYKTGLYHRWDEDHKCFTNACYTMRDFHDIHPRPTIYQSAAQLVDQYRKEHGAEIEADVEGFVTMVGNDGPTLTILIDDAAFHLALLDRYLAAERARIEGET